MFTYFQAFRSLSLTSRQMTERETLIQEALDRGDREITLAPIGAYNKYNCYPPEGDLGLDSAQWPNTSLAIYYGFDVIHSAQEGAGNG